MDFKDKTYIITGATSGIGRCIARTLAKKGARLLLLGRDIKRLNSLKNELSLISQTSHSVAVFDSNNLDSIESAVAEFASEFKLNGFIHSAGALNPMLLRDLNLAKMHELININLLTFFALAKSALKHGRYAKGDTSIVAISSMAAFGAEPGLSVYSASKAALNSAVRSLAKEYSKKGVRINAVAPLFVNTPMYESFASEFISKETQDEQLKEIMPLGLIEPSQVADSVLFLLSSKASSITGECLKISSGGGDLGFGNSKFEC
ncbi:MAG: SDR family oxidoreductase [Campylobacter sp.]|uniref:SDR family NAD(P)-dependent oxidoreductase n=1 Tax=Campylobacter sp. TaxID=205 RepID=UPI001B4E0F28|nr:SDR family oxidoreductase [Campylobacter sp.]MBP3676666.1 SDR family oxidoreductase [Campylobacter sp.]